MHSPLEIQAIVKMTMMMMQRRRLSPSHEMALEIFGIWGM